MLLLPFRHALYLLGLVSTAWAAAPASLAGYVYYQTESTLARNTLAYGLVLADDGSFTPLFSGGTHPLTGEYSNTATAAGTWSYRRLDDASGELTLVVPADSSLAGKRTLRFTAEDAGYLGPADLPTTARSASFRLASAASRPPLVNCSNRAYVRPGGAASTGFVVTGSSPRAVLVRAVGPGLAAFGVNDPLARPRLVITRGAATIARNDGWESAGSASVRQTSAYVGAFPLAADAKDAAVVLALVPDAYVATVSAADAAESGQVLIEIYVLP